MIRLVCNTCCAFCVRAQKSESVCICRRSSNFETCVYVCRLVVFPWTSVDLALGYVSSETRLVSRNGALHGVVGPECVLRMGKCYGRGVTKDRWVWMEGDGRWCCFTRHGKVCLGSVLNDRD
ncbi:hypothetical protein DFP72DRAFT_909719 [Ephemerocybe angulata]|uniref:Uncharacterized protein n=1 Tax=Ephemerocybe angulata TaxID=980116 RepID=A0A8H6M098_9AGAR|nr:hypothetical protein DFP72DRAFT_909719 [Tulosesus angulatus]